MSYRLMHEAHLVTNGTSDRKNRFSMPPRGNHEPYWDTPPAIGDTVNLFGYDLRVIAQIDEWYLLVASPEDMRELTRKTFGDFQVPSDLNHD